MREYPVNNFKNGTINQVEDISIPDGAASDSKNWLTMGDKIETRRGSHIIGTDAGTGACTGFWVAHKVDGTQIMYRKNGAKLEYYNTTTLDWVEVGTNLFGAHTTEEVSFSNYDSLSGSQLWICSPNTGLYKIMTANPTSYSTMYSAAKNYKGKIKISQNRMWLWHRNEDKTGVYGSYIDTQTYTTVTGEATASLSGTLAFKAAGATRTCFGVAITITATSELYTDDYNGVLTGSLGGTGTINYTTGAYTLSNPGVGTAAYQWEDSNNNGVSDFTMSSPRTAGQGFNFRQDDGGGDLLTVQIYNDVEYCIHETKTWKLELTIDDTNASNKIFRDRIGMKSWKGCVSTGEGIYYMDTSDNNKPRFKLLTLDRISAEVIPTDVSLNYDFSDYEFDNCVMEEWQDYILIGCRASTSTTNDTLFVYNKLWKSLDRLDYYTSFFGIYNGALYAGDTTTKNIWVLFSAWDDDDATINNYWEGGYSMLKTHNLKKFKNFLVKGLISKNQTCKVYIDFDNSGYTEIGEIDGNASYVDFGQSVCIGATTIGSKEVGGGSGAEYAYNFEVWFDIAVSKFRRAKIKFEAQDLGYVGISEFNFHDINLYKDKNLSKYTV